MRVRVYTDSEAFPVENPPRRSCPAHVLGCLRLGGHVRLAECDGQLQVLLFLPPQPRQPLLLRLLTFPLGPRQLLLLIAKLQGKNTGWVTWLGSCSHRPGVGCVGTGEETEKRPVKGGQEAGNRTQCWDAWGGGGGVKNQKKPKACILAGVGKGTRTPSPDTQSGRGHMHEKQG